jgi:DNA-binding transcriptional regulator GbsR (MarR family)
MPIVSEKYGVRYILSVDEYRKIQETIENNKTFNLYENIYTNIYNKSYYDLLRCGIITNEDINESFIDFKDKLKNAIGDINQKIVAKVDSVISNIKAFVQNAADFLGDLFDSIWNFAKKNMDVYVKNIISVYKTTIDITKKGFNEEIEWIKNIYNWFKDDFKTVFINLFKKSVSDGVNESLEYYDTFRLIVENDVQELESDEEVDTMFNKVVLNMKKSAAYKMLVELFDILGKVAKGLEKMIETNANKVMVSISNIIEKIKGLPKSPGDFPNTSKLFSMCVIQIAKQEGLDKGYLEPKKLSIILIKKFIKTFLRGVIPGVDILLLSLKIKSYFILFGTVIKTLLAK